MPGRVLATVPLLHVCKRRTDPGSYTRITESMSEYTCDGHTALGMSEFCDVMSGGVPISVSAGEAA